MENLKPREKLIKHSVKVLKNSELIAILLRTGTKDKPVLKLSEEVLELLTNIRSLKNITVFDLLSIKGISNAKATTIIAAVELGSRIRESRINGNSDAIYSSSDVYDYLREDMEYLEQEHLVVLCLNIKGYIIKRETIYIGTTNAIPISVKEIFKSAIKINAHGIVLVHNHPSGDSTPSNADNKLTKKLKEAAELLAIQFIDHIMIGSNEFYSYLLEEIIKVWYNKTRRFYYGKQEN